MDRNKSKILFRASIAVIFVAAFWIYKTRPTKTVSLTRTATSENPLIDSQTQQALDEHSKQSDSSLSSEPANITSQKYSLVTQEKIKTLDQILISKNDNDPRIDTAFKNLTYEEKAALKDHYNELKMEDRNGRGTIIFLLGRNLQTTADIGFFKNVLIESPCLSLSDCQKFNASEKESHLESANDVTKNYPQVVALNRIEAAMSEQMNDSSSQLNSDSQYRQSIIDALQAASNSQVYIIKSKATDLLNQVYKKYGH